MKKKKLTNSIFNISIITVLLIGLKVKLVGSVGVNL